MDISYRLLGRSSMKPDVSSHFMSSYCHIAREVANPVTGFYSMEEVMITRTFSIVVFLKLCSVADQVRYFYCQQWAHLEETQFHAKDNDFLVQPPFLSYFAPPQSVPYTTGWYIQTVKAQLLLYPPSQSLYVSFIMGSLFSLPTPWTLSRPCLWWFFNLKCSSFLLNL